MKGRLVKVCLSRFAMETVLSPSVVYFFEAHLHCDDDSLERHFSQFGQVHLGIYLFFVNNLTIYISSKLLRKKMSFSEVQQHYGYADVHMSGLTRDSAIHGLTHRRDLEHLLVGR